jgi:hypothetical protein
VCLCVTTPHRRSPLMYRLREMRMSAGRMCRRVAPAAA